MSERKMKMKSKKGIAFISLGLALIIGAMSLITYNKIEEKRAGENAELVLQELDNKLSNEIPDPDPAYKVENEVPMPTVVIDGYEYVGKIYFPKLKLTLPIISGVGDKRLKKAPCKYFGSVYTDNMILAGHNYITHFGRIDNLRYGDKVVFTDVDGNEFKYKVLGTEIINGNDGYTLEDGDWDLSLFTCTMSGRSRITVRCVREK